MSVLPIIEAGTKKATVLPLLDCNARCPFCSTRVYTEDGVRSTTDFGTGLLRKLKDYTQSFEEVRATYDTLVASGVERINIQGGEPTMWEPLPELLRHGHTLGLREQTIVSNGRRFKDRAYADTIVAAGPNTIVLSLFGARAETHDQSMGLKGAFADVVPGVRNLVAATQARTDRHVSLMAQFSLHRHNHHELPEMFRFWYEQGLRDFTVRLLRDTVNTQLHPDDDWFFDLRTLKEPLERALDFVRTKSDVFVCTSEVFYCLLSPSYLGDVLKDVGSNPNLSGKSLHVNRHFALGLGDARTRAGGERAPACTTCDLAPVCVRLESQYLPRYTGDLRSVAVEQQLRSLVDEGVPAARAAEAEALLEVDSKLHQYGVEPALVADLWRKTLGQLDAPQLANRLLPQREQDGLRQSLSRFANRRVLVRRLTLAELAGKGPLNADPKETIARLGAGATAAQAKQLATLLERGAVLARGESLLLFGSPRRDADGKDAIVLTAIVDDLRLDEETTWRLLSPFIEEISLKQAL